MKKIENCNLCGSRKLANFIIGQDRMYNLPGIFQGVKCSECGLVFVNPQPGKEELSKHYPEKYYSFSGEIKRNKFAEFLYFTFFADEGNKFLKVLFYPLFPFFRTAIIEKGAKLLDIGCGNGVFLSRMKTLGLNVYGVDPFIQKDIPSLNIKKGELNTVGFTQESFDIITLNNVLEHVSDPDDTIKSAAKLLKTGGRIIIGVPNKNGVLARLFGTYWAELDFPRHLFHFNKHTLSALCEKHNLVIKKVRYISVPFEILGSVVYLLNAFRKKPKNLQNSFIANSKLCSLLCLPLCHVLSWSKLGGRIELVAEKSLLD
ncbi:hypothetical protein COV18_02110 [Candidatus Woesearchaeota archaeon CG10_big_fil_rev_8_21_14_0_10_37_12]|nr:MAG: hypothetical protein COV18_02110 [Candidatus Woesearchaeota archaeon CG10_big_fil_rev_8_21_14_0_10_37_12]